MWCKRGEVLVAWRCVVQGHHLKLLWPYVRTCLHALGDRLVVDKSPSVDEVRPKVVIRGEEFFVPEHYPKDASGRLEYDKNLIKELEEKTTGVIRNMCKHNPPSAQPTYKDKKSDLIYKRVFCDFI